MTSARQIGARTLIRVWGWVRVTWLSSGHLDLLLSGDGLG